ncbi:hypothetical protein PUNSTDRAFT_104585 [Punctularia strigosozonata HHB-11173 SS5]|uniref:uncharacterized protein n=1 Tax=Punctularia strigosozonata (strain HHB-11173) TaxID=741275 RepID=UPI0004418414|nr:uncharacterized protein PUNSTDRAFT_104585 [Punctularia strigosozonata HHB-11173 SS5]EIN07089.1 hypothetical protein PUNSTDRAFT_104585 [Punctularia strigosozonata HHB-11173 SS5]
MAAKDATSTLPLQPTKPSGLRSALQYTGIPPSWFEKRPKLPSRNWLIFISVTASITGYYLYDRRECKRIRQEYVDRVKHLAEAPLGTMELPRKVTVYGGKWPGDDDYDRSMKYFRKYVKPILVAAAVDYDMIKGKRLGDISNHVAESIKTRRRIDAGLEPLPSLATPAVQKRTPEQELEGGIVLIGRSTFKEFMHGLVRGWTEGLEKVDREEQLANELANDGAFDEPDTESLASTTSRPLADDEPIPTPSRLAPSRVLPGTLAQFKMPGMTQASPSSSIISVTSSIPAHLNAPPESIPPLPPLLLVSFTNFVGLKLIPHMIWDFFNERYKVASGSRDGYKLVMGITRPFLAPPPSLNAPAFDPSIDPVQDLRPQLDLDFDRDVESYYKNSLQKIPSEIESSRKSYYKSLAEKLVTARALARGDREPTKEELQNPPPTEVELRAERIKKELRWRGDLEGWEIVKPENQTLWDERLRGVLKVFVDPPEDGALPSSDDKTETRA